MIFKMKIEGYKKLTRKQLEKDHRRELITLDGFFGNKWRILQDKEETRLKILIIYGNHRKITRHFGEYMQLRGILQGIHLGRIIDDSFLNWRELYEEKRALEKVF